MNIYAVDFETYYDSEYSLTVLGPDAYCWDARFNPYLVAISGSDGLRYSGPLHTAPWAQMAGQHWVSHNARLDETVALNTTIPARPDVWNCTADLSCGLRGPRSLKDAAYVWLGKAVDKSERDRAKGKVPVPDQAMCDYAQKDADLCLQLWQQLSPDWPAMERRISRETRTMGRHGIGVDRERLERDIQALQEEKFDAEKSIPWADGEAAILSHNNVRLACREAGIPAPASLSEDDEGCAQWETQYGDQYPFVGALRRWRKANTLLKKAEAVRRRINPVTGRMAYTLKYFGAHTGRFAGADGINMQNLPKYPYVTASGHVVDARAWFHAAPGKKFAVVDLAQIEARVLLWLVGDAVTLDLIRSGISVYEAHARATMGWTGGELKKERPDIYSLAKGRVLGLGYSCGAKKFVTLAQIYGVTLTEAQALEAVQAYRASNPLITQFWQRCQEWLLWAARAKEDLNVKLKSGRALSYFDFHSLPSDRPGGRMELRARTTRNGNLTRIYGGLLTENIVQATARDLFMDGYLRLIDAGLPPVLHVHDEYVCEVPEDSSKKDLQEIERIVTLSSSWADGLPVGVEGQLRNEYFK